MDFKNSVIDEVIVYQLVIDMKKHGKRWVTCLRNHVTNLHNIFSFQPLAQSATVRQNSLHPIHRHQISTEQFHKTENIFYPQALIQYY